jgi:NADPH-dependent glutamate synthase beta subunit-like oxidoreductase
MHNSNLGQLQSVLVSAMRCLDCRDPRCVNLCPEHVDVRAAMQLIVARSPSAVPSAWTQNVEQAVVSAMDGIEASFEWH